MTPQNKDTTQGRDDPKDWKDTGIDTLRDTKGGAYGTLPGTDDPAPVKEYATEQKREQHGTDVRPNAEPMRRHCPKVCSVRASGRMAGKSGANRGLKVDSAQ